MADFYHMLQSRFQSTFDRLEQETPPNKPALEFLDEYFTILPTGKIQVHWWKVVSNLVEFVARLVVARLRTRRQAAVIKNISEGAATP